MALIDVLTIIACLVVGAFTVRLGNRALLKQRIKKKRRWQREKEVAEGHATEMAIHDLELWRKQDHLKATEASWEELLRLATEHPEAVLELRRIVELNIERTGGRGQVGIVLADEDTKEYAGGFKDERESEPKDTLMVKTPLLTP